MDNTRPQMPLAVKEAQGGLQDRTRHCNIHQFLIPLRNVYVHDPETSSSVFSTLVDARPPFSLWTSLSILVLLISHAHLPSPS